MCRLHRKIMEIEDILLQIKEILTKSSLKIACAESCTGGLISSYLTDIAGSSEYIEQNFVTYSNAAKIRFLNVKKETLDSYGAVSSQTAYEMALGLLEYEPVSIATTGILGPSGGSADKPVGLCYMGFGIKTGSKVIVKTVKFNSALADEDTQNKRVKIKKDIAKNALLNLIGFLRENIATCKET